MELTETSMSPESMIMMDGNDFHQCQQQQKQPSLATKEIQLQDTVSTVGAEQELPHQHAQMLSYCSRNSTTTTTTTTTTTMTTTIPRSNHQWYTTDSLQS
jgi:hypothetical protein